MKTSGIIRQIDELGRIVIPKEMRAVLNIGSRDEISIEMVPAGVLLTPVKACCAICGVTTDLVQLDDAAVCRDCLKLYNDKAAEDDKT